MELIAAATAKTGSNPSARQRSNIAQAKSEPIGREESKQLDRKERDLNYRIKGDPGKVGLAR